VNDQSSPAYPAPATAPTPTPAPAPTPTPAPAPSPAPDRDGFYLGPLRVTIPLVLVLLVMLGSAAFIGWALINVRDDQINLLSIGFVALGASFAALAVGSLVGMWRAASRARGGRAFALAIVGGLAGLAAIGAFTATALMLLVSNT
jgi:hypothetical protein